MYYYVDEVKDVFKFSKTLFICWLIVLALLCSIPSVFFFWVQSNHATCYAYSACGKDKKGVTCKSRDVPEWESE